MELAKTENTTPRILFKVQVPMHPRSGSTCLIYTEDRSVIYSAGLPTLAKQMREEEELKIYCYGTIEEGIINLHPHERERDPIKTDW